MKPDDEEIPAEAIARIVHGAHRDLQEWLEDACPAQPWDTLNPAQREIVVNMVRLIQRGFPTEYVHQIWVDKMTEDGWALGAVKDPARKRHPCMIPWHKLPWWEQQKLHLSYVITARMTQGR